MAPVYETSSHPLPRHFDLKMAALGAWLIGGIFTDGWAHNHIHVESFFTPWHAVLYSGYLANLAYGVLNVVRARKQGRSWREAIPYGYEMTAFGIVLFGLAGVGDMIWHLIF